MDLEGIEERLARLAKANREVAIQFVFTELSVGLACCKRLRENQYLSPVSKQANLEIARTALAVAEKFMWMAKMAHPEFDQMTALAERLTLELASLAPDTK